MYTLGRAPWGQMQGAVTQAMPGRENRGRLTRFPLFRRTAGPENRETGETSPVFPSGLLLLLVAAAPFRSNSSSSPDAWPQFRGNPQLTGAASGVPAQHLKLLWTYDAGDSIESSAAIADGSVFVGSMSGDLVSLDLEKGSLRWKYRTSQGIGESSPAVVNEIVYVGDLAGMFHAVGARHGTRLWTFKTGGEIRSSPMVVDDKVLVGSYDEHLYCLSARTGSLIWKLKTEGPVHCTVGFLEGLVYVAGCDELFRAVRISDGKEIFNLPSGSYTAASPALLAKAAYYGTFNNDVVRVDLQTRRITWRYQPPLRQFPFYSSAAVADGKVVVGSRDKMVHCLDAQTGKARWTFATQARVESSPAIVGNRVYVGSNDGRFYVLDLATGAKIWEFHAGFPLSASPAVASGRIVIGSQDGRLYCFG